MSKAGSSFHYLQRLILYYQNAMYVPTCDVLKERIKYYIVSHLDVVLLLLGWYRCLLKLLKTRGDLILKNICSQY